MLHSCKLPSEALFLVMTGFRVGWENWNCGVIGLLICGGGLGMALTQILKLASNGCAFLLSCYLFYLSRLCGFFISVGWWVFPSVILKSSGLTMTFLCLSVMSAAWNASRANVKLASSEKLSTEFNRWLFLSRCSHLGVFNTHFEKLKNIKNGQVLFWFSQWSDGFLLCVAVEIPVVSRQYCSKCPCELTQGEETPGLRSPHSPAHFCRYWKQPVSTSRGLCIGSYSGQSGYRFSLFYCDTKNVMLSLLSLKWIVESK